MRLDMTTSDALLTDAGTSSDKADALDLTLA
jgi:hypothetical protein